MIRIPTKNLLALLDDLARTTSGSNGPTGGVLLHTTRGPKADEPGLTDLLVGTATDGVCVGHTYVESTGQLARPSLWPLADVRAVAASFKPKAQALKDHAVEIVVDGTGVIVREDQNLFSDGLNVTFSEGPVDDYPRGLWRAIEDTPYIADDAKALQPRSDFHEFALKPFLAIAKRRNAPLELYRYHQTARWLVQIGDRYRGSVFPVRPGWQSGTPAGDEPSGDVHAPRFGDGE